MTDLERLSARIATARDVVAALERDGGVIVESFLKPDTLDGLRRDLLSRFERQPVGRDSFSGFHTRRLSRLFARTRHCAEIATHPLYLPVAEHFLCRPRAAWVGSERMMVAADVRIGVTQAIQIGPGQTAQPLHRDDTAFLWQHPTNGYEGRVQIICAVSDFTAENGGTPRHSAEPSLGRRPQARHVGSDSDRHGRGLGADFSRLDVPCRRREFHANGVSDRGWNSARRI